MITMKNDKFENEMNDDFGIVCSTPFNCGIFFQLAFFGFYMFVLRSKYELTVVVCVCAK